MREEPYPSTKVCKACQVEKDRSMFSPSKKNKYGLYVKCKLCYFKAQKATREKKKAYYEAYRKKYQETDKYKTWRKTYVKKPKQALDVNVSRKISDGLKGKLKQSDVEGYIGYKFSDLTKHLESKFTQGMSWDNYTKYWCIDHIKPKSLFNYSSPNDVEFKKCWALSNLQPLTIAENAQKAHFYKTN